VQGGLPRLGADRPIFVAGDARAAQGSGERATRRRLFAARLRGARPVLGASCRSTDATGVAPDLVVEAQSQGDPLARLIDVQDLDPYDVAGLTRRRRSCR
jgi:hypothetical protein